MDAEALPEAAIRALRLPTAAMATSTPDSEVVPKNELFGLERSISPVLEVIEEGAHDVIAPAWVMSPTDVVFRPPVKVVRPTTLPLAGARTVARASWSRSIWRSPRPRARTWPTTTA